ncbi:MAG: acyl-CoA dehydrogenase [Gammaproteobacteria bacterium]|nr:acyl-CoA dehydrogenase [Gammaproteobacteria bacterium]
MNAAFSVVTLAGSAIGGVLLAILKWIGQALLLVVLLLSAAFGWLVGLLWTALAWAARLTGLTFLRRKLITAPIYKIFRRVLPPISETERAALDAGNVWWDGELFSGKPDWSKLQSLPAPRLSDEEQAFLDGPCEELCAMLDDWKITHEWADLSPELWAFLRNKGFFAMIIPKRYGGLEFSNFAHSQVLLKIGSVSITVSSIVSVPNSLGPAELLMHYGTDAQREYYLPRLADGREVPCFALTSPSAGSDATSIHDTGVVCREEWRGEKVLGIRLNWDKRYITLAPVATLLGLAFKLHDPEHLMGDEDEYGITCALVPTNLPGITIGRRHFPINIPFQNGPTQGEDVFIPLENIIGGPARAGEGWRMLVENLSVGRSISLPTNATGGAKVGVFTSGAYARIRKQFNVPISAFEGVQEALARMASNLYTADAARCMTLAALDAGEKPAVPAAIVKYHVTELARSVANDAMDVHGGKGIMLGPNNYLARGWQATPIAITVEGANIMTRSLMIFGQGAIRAHPYILDEMEAAGLDDRAEGNKRFDRLFFRHVRFLLGNGARAALGAASGGRLGGRVPADEGFADRYRRLNRYSAAFALLADATMLTLGGALKRRERLSSRLGDLLSLLYLASSVLKHHADHGSPEADAAIVDHALDELEYRFETTFETILENFPNRSLARVLRLVALPFGRRASPPADELGARVAALVSAPTKTRERLAAGIHTGTGPCAGMDEALELALWAEPLEKKLRKAERAGEWTAAPGSSEAQRAQAAAKAGVLSSEEADRLARYYDMVAQILAVDDFAPAEMAASPLPATENDRIAAWRKGETDFG